MELENLTKVNELAERLRRLQDMQTAISETQNPAIQIRSDYMDLWLSSTFGLLDWSGDIFLKECRSIIRDEINRIEDEIKKL